MTDEKDQKTEEEASEAAAEGPGNVSVDEPTATSLDTDEDAFDEAGKQEGRAEDS